MVGYLSTAEDITERVRTQDALEAALETERERWPTSPRSTAPRTPSSPASATSCGPRSPTSSATSSSSSTARTARRLGPQHEALGRIDANSHRLLELIDDLLTLSSVESLDVELIQEPVDLRDVLRRAGREVRHRRSPDRGQHLDVEVPSEPVVVLGDEVHLDRMVANLATNAVKFTPDGGRITLRLRPRRGPDAIEVQDTGVGIPEEERPLLFNRFYRSTYAQTEAVKGSGLGLSIARSIAQRHGARISADLAPRGGARCSPSPSRARRLPCPSPERPIRPIESEIGQSSIEAVSGLPSGARPSGPRGHLPTADEGRVPCTARDRTACWPPAWRRLRCCSPCCALRIAPDPELVARWWPATALATVVLLLAPATARSR